MKKNRKKERFLYKNVKEINIIFLILIGVVLVGISGFFSYAIFTNEVTSPNEIRGIVTKKTNLDKSGANPPSITNNMIPVYYDESDSSWKKADANNSKEQYKWYDYDNKRWANAVTVQELKAGDTISTEAKPEYFYKSGNKGVQSTTSTAKFTFTTGSTGGEFSFDYYASTVHGHYFSITINNAGVTTDPIGGTNLLQDEVAPVTYKATAAANTTYTIIATYQKNTGTYSPAPVLDEAVIGNFKLPANLSKNFEYVPSSTYTWTVHSPKKVREEYVKAAPSTKIDDRDINTMWVWIPRYKYTYFASATPTEIPITFESDTNSTGTIKCTDALVSGSGKSETCTDTTNGSLTVGISTYTHPAFTFGDQELTGLWVGKFENSAAMITGIKGDETQLRTVIVKPNMLSYANTKISYMANSIRSMEIKDNIYGFPQTGITLNTYTGEISGDSNTIDTHMMKNTEWGLVSYFAHSKYGLCTNGTCNEIGINPYKYEVTTNSSTYNLPETGHGAVAGTNSTTDATGKYNTENGKLASTTGNIYGIYDMSGGAEEYVMGNMLDSSNQLYPRSCGTWTTTNAPLDKYYDKYSYKSGSTGRREYSRGRLGDATVELSPASYKSWYDDGSNFVGTSASSSTTYYPWFMRGGQFTGATSAGLFNFTNRHGIGNTNYGSRSVLAIAE